MIKCKYDINRMVPISYNKNELFKSLHYNYFFMCHIASGNAILLINGEKFYLSSNTLLSFPRNTKIELLASYKLKAHSISFAPEFININLNWELIESKDFGIISKDLDYPCFDLFFQRNILYEGILPLDIALNEKVNQYFLDITKELEEQTDKMWSCRSRATIYSLFEMTEHFCREFMSGDREVSTLEAKVLDYIHLNLCKPITIAMLCKLFYSNHTTICRKFKALTGHSITDYIVEKRLLLAKHSLAFTHLSVGEISEKYGFNNASYFIRIFSKRVGMSPVKYRQYMRKKRADKVL